MAKISVIVNTLNEEANIARALASVKHFADEIVVVDMNSTDDTVEIAKEFGAKVYAHKRVDYVEPARNYAISKATGDWTLILDADERVPDTLAKKLKKLSKSADIDYFRIPRKNLVFGKWLKHSRWWPDYNVRFFRAGTVSWDELIHSVPMTTGVGKDVPDLEEYALVHSHYTSIDQYIRRMNRYTTIQSKQKRKEGYKFNWRDLISKPGGEFLSRYFFGEGFKDGVHGLAVAMLQAFSELVLYLKIWQSEKFYKKGLNPEKVSRELKYFESDLRYWQADMLYKINGGILQKIKRRLRLP